MLDRVDGHGPWGAPPADQAETPQIGPETLRFAFVKRPGLLRLTIINFLLGLITLGIYRFWGKTRVRQHIWSSVHINEEPLEYTGTGGELFKGFLVVLFTILLPAVIILAVVETVYGRESTQYQLTYFGMIIISQLFIGYALYSSRNYQLTRTNWRGIRGALTGSPTRYMLTYFGSMFAKVFSLGWAAPVMDLLLQEQMIGDMKFGDAAFKFKGKAGPLYPTFTICWFLTLGLVILIPFAVWFEVHTVLGLSIEEVFKRAEGPKTPDIVSSVLKILAVFMAAVLLFMLIFPMLWAIYSAKQFRTFATYSRFDGAPFKFEATTGSLIWLTIVNLLILVLTVGIGRPFIQRRLVRYFIDRLSVNGMVDIDRIRQSSAAALSRGDGLADAFELGTF